MGYYAVGRGELTVNEDDEDEVIGLIGGFDSEWQVVDFCGEGLSVEFNGKYNTERIRGELDQLRPFVKDGSCIQFTGEDNNVWRMTFEGETIVEATAVFLTAEEVQALSMAGKSGS